jgi:hypothetical protein
LQAQCIPAVTGSSPSTCKLPLSGLSKPAISRSRVVLPAPSGPTSPVMMTATDVGIQRMQGRATGKGMAQRTQADGDGLTHGHNHACFTVTGMP